MADPRAFLSFDFDHNLTSRTLFAGQAKDDSPTPFVVQDWSSKSTLPEAEWEKLIKDKINKCHLLIVLVGKSMSTATGVSKEIKFASDQNVPVFGVYVDGAGELNPLPTGLARSRTVKWDWAKIGDMIDKCMTEGKNK